MRICCYFFCSQFTMQFKMKCSRKYRIPYTYANTKPFTSTYIDSLCNFFSNSAGFLIYYILCIFVIVTIKNYLFERIVNISQQQFIHAIYDTRSASILILQFVTNEDTHSSSSNNNDNKN